MSSGYQPQTQESIEPHCGNIYKLRLLCGSFSQKDDGFFPGDFLDGKVTPYFREIVREILPEFFFRNRYQPSLFRIESRKVIEFGMLLI